MRRKIESLKTQIKPEKLKTKKRERKKEKNMTHINTTLLIISFHNQYSKYMS